MTFDFLYKSLKSWLLLTLLVLLPSFSIAQNTYVVTAYALNVRKSASIESTIIGSLSKGDNVSVRELKTNWAEIDFNNGVGYVSTKYIQIVEKEQQQEPELEIKVEPETFVKDIEVQSATEEMVSSEQPKPSKRVHFRLTSTLSLGLSNFSSPKAYSNPRFGFGLDAGGQFTADFLPKWMITEATVGFEMLGNSKYSFPSFSLNILPIGYRSNSIGKSKGVRLYAIGGVSFQFSKGRISFYKNSQYYSFKSQPTVNLYIKGGVEITDMIAVGISYIYGLSNVCSGLPINIKNSVLQIHGSFMFDKWRKK